jgi:hypothetical protein
MDGVVELLGRDMLTEPDPLMDTGRTCTIVRKKVWGIV